MKSASHPDNLARMGTLHKLTRILGLALGGAALLGVAIATPVDADTNDFSYDSWHVEYDIALDDQGRAIAEVTETLTARFPDFDQNRGIVRGLPLEYEDASTDPRDFTVTDETGASIPFWTEEEDGFVAVLTGDDDFVHGEHTYVIQYTLSDLILARDDGKADEFYWDLVDHEHYQTIDSATAEIRFSDELADALDGNARCYYGHSYSQDECGIMQRSDGTAFQISPMFLDRREGMTVAIGLEPGVVAQPHVRLPSFILDVLPTVAGAASVAAGVIGTIALSILKRKRRSYRGTVVAQYDVPDHLPPLIAAPLVNKSAASVPAEFVHLAVCGAMRIEDSEETTGIFGSGKPLPQFRLIDPKRVTDPLDKETLNELFFGNFPGKVFTLPKKSSSFASRMQKLRAQGMKHATSRGYFTTERSRAAFIFGLTGLALAIIALILSFIGLDRDNAVLQVVAFVASGLGLLLAGWTIPRHRVHTPLGAEAREYLEGVRLFIRIAEADRLQMLQSYTGAERRKDGSVNVVLLYERLLPYAMLFGLEKEWSRVLEVTYQNTGEAPLWYPGLAHHGLGNMSSSISSFTSNLSSSTSYSSSSSGGSSGGGFSGGGGGGGFSGGR